MHVNRPQVGYSSSPRPRDHSTSRLSEPALDQPGSKQTARVSVASYLGTLSPTRPHTRLDQVCMPKTSPAKLYQRTKALLTPPSSPPNAPLSHSSLETSPRMTKRSAHETTSTETTTIAEHPEHEVNDAVRVPKSEWKAPRKIGIVESWLIFYEGMFAGSMLETVSHVPCRLLSPRRGAFADGQGGNVDLVQWEKVLLRAFLFRVLCSLDEWTPT